MVVDVVVVLVDVDVCGDVLGAVETVAAEWLGVAVSRMDPLDRCEVLVNVANRLDVVLMADEGATDAGRLFMTMPVASPSVKTPVTTQEMIART